MRAVNDKRIAAWLGVSSATYYRWREAGILAQCPKSREEAEEMRRRIDDAREAAALARKRGLRGRTSLCSLVEVLGGRS